MRYSLFIDAIMAFLWDYGIRTPDLAAIRLSSLWQEFQGAGAGKGRFARSSAFLPFWRYIPLALAATCEMRHRAPV